MSIVSSPTHNEWAGYRNASGRLFALFCVQRLRYDQAAVMEQHFAC
jgi:hypothetical protein